MSFSFEPMDADGFREIESWRYPPPYHFYDGDVDPVIVGFLYFEERGPRLEYGLGLRPDLVGRGLGEAFFRAGLEFGRERYEPAAVQLSVAKFNDRARIVYERAGFRVVGEHNRTFARWGVVPFLDMEEVR